MTSPILFLFYYVKGLGAMLLLIECVIGIIWILVMVTNMLSITISIGDIEPSKHPIRAYWTHIKGLWKDGQFVCPFDPVHRLRSSLVSIVFLTILWMIIAVPPILVSIIFEFIVHQVYTELEKIFVK